MIKKPLLFILVSLMVFLTACDSSKNAQQPIQTLQVTKDIENVAWMREKLPADTLAYMRLPTLWTLLFESKADALYSVQKLDTHVVQINQFKQGILDTFSSLIPKQAHLPFKALIKNMVTPLEIAIINATDGSMVPNNLTATTLKDTSIEDLNTLINTLVQSVPQIQILKPVDAKGHAKLRVAMIPVFVSFDVNSGRLALYSGLTATEMGLQNMLAQKQHAKELNHIFTFENSVDQAGKNLELWLNLQAIYQQNKGFIPPNFQPMVQKFGLDKMQYLWAGTASINGKSELIFRLSMPEVGFRQFMPRTNSKFDIKTAGTPRSVWQITTPTEQQFIQGYELFLSFQSNPDEIRKKVNEVISEINEFIGVSLSEISKTYGQKTVIVTDDSGTWFAFKINDLKAHTRIVDKISDAFGTKSSTKKLAGVDINQSIFSFKNLINKIIEKDKSVKPLADIFESKQYSYYQVDGDYLIQATTPQVLADRTNSNNKMELSHWLINQQGHNWNNAIFAYSKEVEDAPRDIYYGYLKALLFLGSLANTEVDLFALPTAQQLKLPKKGRFGMSLDSSSDAITMKLSYEYTVLEGMSSSSPMVIIGITGILAAYAIPAYRDYTLRAKINKKTYSVSKEKRLIEDYYNKHKSFPNTEFLSTKLGQSEEYSYNPKNGQIIIYFTYEDSPKLSEKNITITPIIDSEGYINWQCGGSIDSKRYKYVCY